MAVNRLKDIYCVVCKDTTAHYGPVIQGMFVCLRCKIPVYPDIVLTEAEVNALSEIDRAKYVGGK